MGIFLDVTWVVPLVTTLYYYIFLVVFRLGDPKKNHRKCHSYSYWEGDNPPKSSSKHINLQESPLHHLWIAEYQPLWIYQVGSSADAAEPVYLNAYAVISKLSMYGIFTYIWLKSMANAGKYSIHGAFGICNVCGDERGRFVSFSDSLIHVGQR